MIKKLKKHIKIKAGITRSKGMIKVKFKLKKLMKKTMKIIHVIAHCV